MTDKPTHHQEDSGDDGDVTAIAVLLREHLNSVDQTVAQQITSETVEERLTAIKHLHAQASDGIPVQQWPASAGSHAPGAPVMPVPSI